MRDYTTFDDFTTIRQIQSVQNASQQLKNDVARSISALEQSCLSGSTSKSETCGDELDELLAYLQREGLKAGRAVDLANLDVIGLLTDSSGESELN